MTKQRINIPDLDNGISEQIEADLEDMRQSSDTPLEAKREMEEWEIEELQEDFHLGPLCRFVKSIEYNKLLVWIQGGAYPHVAAKTFGIRVNQWRTWLTRGEKAREGSMYRRLYDDVMIASASARALCETVVKKQAPHVWLTKGPGQDEDGMPGWNDKVSIELNGSQTIEHTGAVSVGDAPMTELKKLEALLVMEEMGHLKLTDEMRSFINAAKDEKKLSLKESHEIPNDKQPLVVGD